MTHLSTTTNNHPNHKVHANHTITKGIAASLLAMATLLPFTSVSAATYPVNPSPANSSMTHITFEVKMSEPSVYKLFQPVPGIGKSI